MSNTNRKIFLLWSWREWDLNSNYNNVYVSVASQPNPKPTTHSTTRLTKIMSEFFFSFRGKFFYIRGEQNKYKQQNFVKQKFEKTLLPDLGKNFIKTHMQCFVHIGQHSISAYIKNLFPSLLFSRLQNFSDAFSTRRVWGDVVGKYVDVGFFLSFFFSFFPPAHVDEEERWALHISSSSYVKKNKKTKEILAVVHTIFWCILSSLHEHERKRRIYILKRNWDLYRGNDTWNWKVLLNFLKLKEFLLNHSVWHHNFVENLTSSYKISTKILNFIRILKF